MVPKRKHLNVDPNLSLNDLAAVYKKKTLDAIDIEPSNPELKSFQKQVANYAFRAAITPTYDNLADLQHHEAALKAVEIYQAEKQSPQVGEVD